MAVKIKPNDEQDFKSFEVEIPNIGWEKRCELNNLMVSANKDEETSLINFCGEIVLKFTELSKEELNKYSSDEIIAISNTIFEEANKKK